MSNKINIHDQVYGICNALGLEATFVKELKITPRTVIADVYLKNDNGSKYVTENGDAAIEVHEFEVVT
jgi:hypothetical protein